MIEPATGGAPACRRCAGVPEFNVAPTLPSGATIRWGLFLNALIGSSSWP